MIIFLILGDSIGGLVGLTETRVVLQSGLNPVRDIDINTDDR